YARPQGTEERHCVDLVDYEVEIAPDGTAIVAERPQMDGPLPPSTNYMNTFQCFFCWRSWKRGRKPFHRVSSPDKAAGNFKTKGLRSAGARMARTTPIGNQNPQRQSSDFAPGIDLLPFSINQLTSATLVVAQDP